jgi:lipopolysaccharide/colanic/teichoic acid biosynthesis glycosyltransferase
LYYLNVTLIYLLRQADREPIDGYLLEAPYDWTLLPVENSSCRLESLLARWQRGCLTKVAVDMRQQLPSSRANNKLRVSAFDASWALLSPLIALFLRDAPVLSEAGAQSAFLYCFGSLLFSILAFLIFRVRGATYDNFSAHDAFNVVKAVVTAELMTTVAIFAFTRLDGIPRSTLLIHALLLSAGLIITRSCAFKFAHHWHKRNDHEEDSEHILLIGTNYLSSVLIEAVDKYFNGQRRVVGILDEAPERIGHAISGIPILGFPKELPALVGEFAIHGIRIDRVVVCVGTESLPNISLEKIRLFCARQNITFDILPDIFQTIATKTTAAPVRSEPVREIEVPGYFAFRRVADFLLATGAIIILLPLLICVSGIVLFTVGSPVLFWQRRLGKNGQAFMVYKFRTLRLPFDKLGRAVAADQREAWIGQLLRKTGLDELPQLFNVLRGDMSLIGPRPLLPEDQPPNAAVRLAIRPGITGWAQVNGAKLLTPEEKHDLDGWYLTNASIWLDLKIVMMTIRYMLVGERKSDDTSSLARQVPQPERVRNSTRAAS